MKSQYGTKDFDLVSEDVCYQGFFKLVRFNFKYRRFDGRWSRVVSREIFVRGNASCVLLFDPDNDKVVLVEQIRAGGFASEESPWMLELVAGINESGELPENVVRRESLEEAGVVPEQVMHIQNYYPSPGGSTEQIHLFCGRVNAEGLGGVYGLDEEDEDIKVHVLTLSEVFLALEQGRITNSPAIIALQWLKLNLQRVRVAWGSDA